MIGKRSIYANYTVENITTGKTMEVKVQSDNLYRVCDVIYPVNAVEPQKPVDSSKKEEVRAYKEAKLKYDQKMMAIRNKRQAVLNIYKGRQLNSTDVQDSIGQLLFDLENA